MTKPSSVFSGCSQVGLTGSAACISNTVVLLALLLGGCGSSSRSVSIRDGGTGGRDAAPSSTGEPDGSGGMGGSYGGKQDGSAGSKLDGSAGGQDGAAGVGGSEARLDGPAGVGGSDGRLDGGTGTGQDGAAGVGGSDGKLDVSIAVDGPVRQDGPSGSEDAHGSLDVDSDIPPLSSCSPRPQCLTGQLPVRLTSGSGSQQCTCQTNPCGTKLPSCKCAADLCTRYAGMQCQGYGPGEGILECVAN